MRPTAPSSLVDGATMQGAFAQLHGNFSKLLLQNPSNVNFSSAGSSPVAAVAPIGDALVRVALVAQAASLTAPAVVQLICVDEDTEQEPTASAWRVVAGPVQLLPGYGHLPGTLSDLIPLPNFDTDPSSVHFLGSMPGDSNNTGAFLLLVVSLGTNTTAEAACSASSGAAVHVVDVASLAMHSNAAVAALAGNGSYAGEGMTYLGDVNADGLPDFAFSMTGLEACGQCHNRFAVAVSGLGQGDPWEIVPFSTPAFLEREAPMRSASACAQFGRHLAAVGDINGDNVPDMIVSMPAPTFNDVSLFLVTVNRAGSVLDAVRTHLTPTGVSVLSLLHWPVPHPGLDGRGGEARNAPGACLLHVEDVLLGVYTVRLSLRVEGGVTYTHTDAVHLTVGHAPRPLTTDVGKDGYPRILFGSVEHSLQLYVTSERLSESWFASPHQCPQCTAAPLQLLEDTLLVTPRTNSSTGLIPSAIALLDDSNGRHFAVSTDEESVLVYRIFTKPLLPLLVQSTIVEPGSPVLSLCIAGQLSSSGGGQLFVAVHAKVFFVELSTIGSRPSYELYWSDPLMTSDRISLTSIATPMPSTSNFSMTRPALVIGVESEVNGSWYGPQSKNGSLTFISSYKLRASSYPVELNEQVDMLTKCPSSLAAVGDVDGNGIGDVAFGCRGGNGQIGIVLVTTTLTAMFSRLFMISPCDIAAEASFPVHSLSGAVGSIPNDGVPGVLFGFQDSNGISSLGYMQLMMVGLTPTPHLLVASSMPALAARGYSWHGAETFGSIGSISALRSLDGSIVFAIGNASEYESSTHGVKLARMGSPWSLGASRPGWRGITMPPLAVTATEAITEATSHDWNSASIIWTMDIDGNGARDLIVGLPRHSSGQGAVAILLMSKTDDTRPLQRVVVPLSALAQPSDARTGRVPQFGHAVVSLGDLTADGCPELAVGAPFANNGRGLVFLLKCNTDMQFTIISIIGGGSQAESLAEGADRTVLSHDDSAHFGYALATSFPRRVRGVPLLHVGAPRHASNTGRVIMLQLELLGGDELLRVQTSLTDGSNGSLIIESETLLRPNHRGALFGEQISTETEGHTANVEADTALVALCRGCVHSLVSVRVSGSAVLQQPLTESGSSRPEIPELSSFVALGDVDGGGAADFGLVFSDARKAPQVVLTQAMHQNIHAEIITSSSIGPLLLPPITHSGRLFAAHSAGGSLRCISVPSSRLSSSSHGGNPDLLQWQLTSSVSRKQSTAAMLSSDRLVVSGVSVLTPHDVGLEFSSTATAPSPSGSETQYNGPRFGSSVSSVGDLDGDGSIDLVVGAQGHSGSLASFITIVFMNADGSPAHQNHLSFTDGTIPGSVSPTFYGGSVSAIGDINADGIPDVAIGSQFDDVTDVALIIILMECTGQALDSWIISGTEIGVHSENGHTIDDFTANSDSVQSAISDEPQLQFIHQGPRIAWLKGFGSALVPQMAIVHSNVHHAHIEWIALDEQRRNVSSVQVIDAAQHIQHNETFGVSSTWIPSLAPGIGVLAVSSLADPLDISPHGTSAPAYSSAGVITLFHLASNAGLMRVSNILQTSAMLGFRAEESELEIGWALAAGDVDGDGQAELLFTFRGRKYDGDVAVLSLNSDMHVVKAQILPARLVDVLDDRVGGARVILGSSMGVIPAQGAGAARIMLSSPSMDTSIVKRNGDLSLHSNSSRSGGVAVLQLQATGALRPEEASWPSALSQQTPFHRINPPHTAAQFGASITVLERNDLEFVVAIGAPAAADTNGRTAGVVYLTTVDAHTIQWANSSQGWLATIDSSTFGHSQLANSAAFGKSICTGDFNRDGILDLAVLSNPGLSVFALNSTQPLGLLAQMYQNVSQMLPPSGILGSQGLESISAGSVPAGPSGASASVLGWWPGVGTLASTCIVQLQFSVFPASLSVVSTQGLCMDDPSITVWASPPAMSLLAMASMGDVDGDGYGDIAVLSSTGFSNLCLMHLTAGFVARHVTCHAVSVAGAGGGPFSIGNVSSLSLQQTAVSAGDLDGDGLPELIVSAPSRVGHGAVYMLNAATGEMSNTGEMGYRDSRFGPLTDSHVTSSAMNHGVAAISDPIGKLAVLLGFPLRGLGDGAGFIVRSDVRVFGAATQPNPCIPATPSPTTSPSSTPIVSSSSSVTTTPSSSSRSTQTVTATVTPSATGLPPLPTPSVTPSAAPSGLAPPARVRVPIVTAAQFRSLPLARRALTVDGNAAEASTLVPVQALALGELTAISFSAQLVGHLPGMSSSQFTALSVASPPQLQAVLADAEAAGTSGANAPTVRIAEPAFSATLKMSEWTSLNTALQVKTDRETIAAALAGQSADSIQSYSGLFFFSVSIISTQGVVVLSAPLLVHVAAPEAQVRPSSLDAYAAPDGTDSTMTLTVDVYAEDAGAVSWHLMSSPADACWVSAVSAGGTAPAVRVPSAVAATAAAENVTATQKGITASASSTRVTITVRLDQLLQGLYTHSLFFVFDDAAGTVQEVPLRMLVASVIPCPTTVQLPSLAPPARTSMDTAVDLTFAFDNVKVRNLARGSVQIEGIAILPGQSQPQLLAEVCFGGGSTSNSAIIAEFVNLQAASALSADDTAWLSTPKDVIVVPEAAAATVPVSVRLAADTVGEAGVYTATLAMLVRDIARDALELAYVTVNTPMLEGPADAAASSTIPLSPQLLTDSLPLHTQQAGAVTRVTAEGTIIVTDGILLAIALLRDSLARVHPANSVMLTANIQSSTFNSSRQLQASVDFLSAKVRPLSAQEMLLALQQLQGQAGYTSVCPAGSLPVACITGGMQLMGIIISQPELSTLHDQSRLTGVLIATGVASRGREIEGADLSQSIHLPLTAITVQGASCSRHGVIQVGLLCACAPGYAAVSASSAVTSHNLQCTPCPAGMRNPRSTILTASTACTQCGDGTFTLAGAAACTACPLGAVCASGILSVMSGYGLSQSGLQQYASEKELADDLLLCPNPGACAFVTSDAQSRSAGGMSFVPSSCIAGQQGTLCAECNNGFTYSPPAGGASVDCIACRGFGVYFVLFMSVFGVALLVILMLSWSALLQAHGHKVHVLQRGANVNGKSSKHVVNSVASEPNQFTSCTTQLPALVPNPSGNHRLLVAESDSFDIDLYEVGFTRVRFLAAVGLMLHLMWSSQLDSYRSGTLDSAVGVSTVSHVVSIIPVQSWYMACSMGVENLMLKLFAVGAALPLVVAVVGTACAVMVTHLLPCLGCAQLQDRAPVAFKSRLVPLIVASLGFVAFMTLPRSILAMMTVFVTVATGQDQKRMLGDLGTAANSGWHIQLQAFAALVVLSWLCAFAFGFTRRRLLAIPAAAAVGIPAVVARNPMFKLKNGTLVARYTPKESARTHVPENRLVFAGLGWLWLLFTPQLWWFAAVWMAQGVALAAAAVLANSLLGRSYWAILGTLCGAVMQWSLDPLLYNRASLQYEPMASMPLGNLQHVALVTAVSNTMFGFMHLGQVIQAGFTYMHAALAQGSLFSGTGDSNPFLDDIKVHLPSTNAAVGAAVNTGFWLPFMLLAAGVLFPRQAFRASVWCGAGRRPALARLMASHLQTGEFGDKTFDPQAPNASSTKPTQKRRRLLDQSSLGVASAAEAARAKLRLRGAVKLAQQPDARGRVEFSQTSVRRFDLSSKSTDSSPVAVARGLQGKTTAGGFARSGPYGALQSSAVATLRGLSWGRVNSASLRRRMGSQDTGHRRASTAAHTEAGGGAAGGLSSARKSQRRAKQRSRVLL